LKLRSTILDGEIVRWIRMAYRDFSCCNDGRNTRPLRLSYICSICFGVMGVTLPSKTVLQRRDRLGQIIKLFPASRLARERTEGIIAKRKTSTSRPGKRSPDWLKIRDRPQQEFVACAFTEGKGSRKHFAALLSNA